FRREAMLALQLRRRGPAAQPHPPAVVGLADDRRDARVAAEVPGRGRAALAPALEAVVAAEQRMLDLRLATGARRQPRHLADRLDLERIGRHQLVQVTHL